MEQENKRNNLKFYRTMKWSGQSLCVTIPKEICTQLQLKNKTKVIINYGTDEIGGYIIIYK
jgi:antitoxin component of MazEF toxin-antitoxin module